MRNNFVHANPLLMAIYSPASVETPSSGQVPDPMFESPSDKRRKQSEDLETAMFEAVEQRASADLRSVAASMLAGWIEDGEPEAVDFDSLAIVMCGLEDVESDDDFTDEQVEAYFTALSALADAAVAMGADQDDVTAMIDEEDDDAASRVFDSLSTGSDAMEESIAEYTVFGGSEDPMFEAVRKKVIRNGKVKIIRKRPRPRRLNAAQKGALKKARRKAHTSVAKMHRKKSMTIRKKRGM
jgi:hypothetical protein